MGVHPAPADLVASGFWKISFAEPAEHWSGNHYGTSQRGAFLHKFGTFHVGTVDFIGLEGIFALFVTGNLDPHVLKQADKVFDIENLRDVADAHGLVGEQYCAENL